VEGWGVGKLGPGGLDQDGEKADGPGGLILGEGDEARFCQVGPLVVQTITGRLSLALAGQVEPLRSGFSGCDAHRLRPESPFSPHRGSGHPGDSAGFRRGLLVFSPSARRCACDCTVVALALGLWLRATGSGSCEAGHFLAERLKAFPPD
jgi:hypothetical protein